MSEKNISQQKSSKMPMIIGAVATIVIIATAAVFLMPGQQKLEKTSPLKMAFLTFAKGKVLVNGKKAKVGLVLYKSDTIQTKKKSIATVQFKSAALLTLKPKTKVKIKNMDVIDNKPVVSLEQKTGSTFNKIVKGKAQYSVASPTAVAGVRGTQFSLTANKNKTIVKLLNGKVKMTPIKKKKVLTKKAVILETGNKIVIKKGKASKQVKLSKAETKTLNSYANVAIVDTPENKKDNDIVVPKKSIKAILKKEASVATVEPKKETKTVKVKKVATKKLTLSDLKKKYGSLTQIKGSNGKVYIGSNWKQVGNFHHINTVTGLKKINTKDVVKVTPLN